VDLRVRAYPVDLRGRGGRVVGTVRSLNGATILLEVGVVAERGDGQPPLAWAEPGPGCLVPHIREPRNRSRAVLVDEHAPLTGPRAVGAGGSAPGKRPCRPPPRRGCPRRSPRVRRTQAQSWPYGCLANSKTLRSPPAHRSAPIPRRSSRL